MSGGSQASERSIAQLHWLMNQVDLWEIESVGPT